MEGNISQQEEKPDNPFTYEEFFIIFGIAIFAIIVNAINDFLQRNQNEERTVAIHAKSCKGDCKPLRHYKIPCVYCKGTFLFFFPIFTKIIRSVLHIFFKTLSIDLGFINRYQNPKSFK